MTRRAPLSALIIAGGRGTRFWPCSREKSPKPLFRADGSQTLLAATIARTLGLVPRDRIFVLVAKSHARAFRRAIRGLISPRNLIIEPAARGTAVAIAFGVATIEHRIGPGVVAVMPADHLIETASQFRLTIAQAASLAAKHASIVVIGIPPTRAEPGFGYQKIGPAIDHGFKVDRFVEKPRIALARRMVRSGQFLWNAGMFVLDSRTLDAELRAHSPRLASGVRAMTGAPDSVIARSYKRLNFDSFDREVVERSSNVLGVRARFRWHDVGSWEGLWEALGNKEAITRGNAIAIDSRRIFAQSDSRLMVLFGVEDIIAVDAGDAILIAHRSRSDSIREVTRELERRGMSRYL